MYQFPAWKYWVVIAVLVIGTVFALPNVFGEDKALQVARKNRAAMDTVAEQQIKETLRTQNITIKGAFLEKGNLVLRFEDGASQYKARDVLIDKQSDNYSVALAHAPRAPGWMRALGLKPMSLGLDLRGGVQFIYEVDVEGAVRQTLGRLEGDIRSTLREKRIPFGSVATQQGGLTVVLRDASQLQEAEEALRKIETGLVVTANPDLPGITVALSPNAIKDRQDGAIQQNLLIMRNRIDQLGVSEPVVARQGKDRILVELPGVQDPNEAKRVLNSTATLEWHMVDEANDPYEAERTKRVPPSDKLYKMRANGAPILVKRELIVSGSQMVDATSGPSNNGLPAVNVKLNSRGGDIMLRNTQQNVGKRMAVVYIEKKRLEAGERCSGTQVGSECTQEDVISAATIQGVFSSNFQITGLQTGEAHELALLLRSGSLATPLYSVAERTVGPSLGEDNIKRGFNAMLVGLVLTFAFMAVYYRAFGWIANAVLAANLVLTIGLLSMLQASLSLPGIAAVVFHLGIAVDANILIYERIREELRLGNSPRAAINAGFEKAFATIADSNVTTLIAGVVLLGIGTGTIRSFAIVMTLGILTSLFTSVVGSRALVHAIWGRRPQLDRLSI